MRMLRSVPTLIRRLRGLPSPERGAVFRATLLLGLARIALALLPFRTVMRFADRAAPRASAPGEPSPEAERKMKTMVWAVTAVGNRLFPTTPCLTQAVVVHRLFRRSGRASELRIGVRKDGRGRFGAHAWVESDGEIVIGGEGLSAGFVPLTSVLPDRTKG